MNAFILAAGLGERLRPLTACLPKPLLPVLGRSALERIIERISALPVRKIGINMHYQWEMIRDQAVSSAFSSKIVLFHESEILGTGGALKNASHLLDESAFLVHNSDILTDISLERLVAAHLSSGNLATLATHHLPPHNNVWIDKEGSVRAVGSVPDYRSAGLRPVAFTGIAVYSPHFLRFLPEGSSSVVDAWLSAAGLGEKVGTLDFTGSFWGDIGTPISYFTTVFRMLRDKGEIVYVHPSVNCRQTEIEGKVVIEEGCHIEGGAFLKDCILLPGSHVASGSRMENLVAGPGCELKIENGGSLPAGTMGVGTPDFREAVFADPIGTGGSDRTYYRLKRGKETFVLMESPGWDPDYERHLAYLKFFEKYSFPVAGLISENVSSLCKLDFLRPSFRYAVFEDLGDISLYSWLRFRREPRRIALLYRKILDKVVNLHTLATEHAGECPFIASRTFDYEHLRWETDYFLEKFINELQGLVVCEKEALIHEFDKLAMKTSLFKKTFIHRDLQSQNVMVCKDDTPYFIDYQGARMGPPAYDIASLLWDPYYRLEDGLRETLLGHYEEGLRAYHGCEFDRSSFRESLLPCRLQRHMQALGAYSFLSMEKGKVYFLRHIPAALKYLIEETELARKDYPAIYSLVRQVHEKT